MKLLFVQIDGKLSNMTAGKFGVPQGSIVGPVLVSIYGRPAEADQISVVAIGSRFLMFPHGKRRWGDGRNKLL